MNEATSEPTSEPSSKADEPNGSVAVMLMAYGTPRTPEEIEPYYTDIRRGRPPTPEALADLVARYAAIGGVSPLAQLTEAQRDALQAALDRSEPGRFRVTLGLKHADPKVEVAARSAAKSGVDSVVGLVLAPHYSSYSIGQYLDRTRQGVDESGVDIPVVGIESWATEPAFVEFLADDLATRVASMRERTGGRVRVLFTAHSLPQRIIDDGDPYPEQLRATAEAVAARVGLLEGDDWQIAWQSAGRTPEPWIGPDILEVIDDLGATRSSSPDDAIAGVIVSACGFVADHLEVLFDLDIEAAERAASHGLAFDRTACVNDDPRVMAALADRVRAIAP
jgi:protoporphyrin/coproporphyrin ferrochelatase